jgi:hypothetical protein
LPPALPADSCAAGGLLRCRRTPALPADSCAAFSDPTDEIREKEYAAYLRARGAQPIHELAAVFDGKRAFVRVAPPG